MLHGKFGSSPDELESLFAAELETLFAPLSSAAAFSASSSHRPLQACSSRPRSSSSHPGKLQGHLAH